MSAKLISGRSEFRYEVVGEADLPIAFNPANGTFEPEAASVVVEDGAVREVSVWGRRWGARGQKVKSNAFLSYTPNDVEDSETDVPNWVVDLIETHTAESA